jgi:hypothetical protein
MVGNGLNVRPIDVGMRITRGETAYHRDRRRGRIGLAGFAGLPDLLALLEFGKVFWGFDIHD